MGIYKLQYPAACGGDPLLLPYILGMAESSGVQVFTDAVWAVWEPLIEAVRPRGKTAPKELRRTISAIFWRYQNGAKWRSIPAELGPWWLGHNSSSAGPRRASGRTCSTLSSSAASRSA